MSARIVARCSAAVAFATANLWPVGSAFASQGPGIASGTAGAMTQLGMAIAVYGGSALIIVAGLIGAARHRFWRRS